MSSNLSCKNVNPFIKFVKAPLLHTWIVADLEVTLFEEKVLISAGRQVAIDSVISAEISGLTVNENDDPVTAYNVYKLYINNVQVSHSGFEADTDQYAPNLSSCSLMWGGNTSHTTTNTIKVTAQLIQQGNSSTIANSNVSNSIKNFRGAKGASLRIMVL